MQHGLGGRDDRVADAGQADVDGGVHLRTEQSVRIGDFDETGQSLGLGVHAGLEEQHFSVPGLPRIGVQGDLGAQAGAQILDGPFVEFDLDPERGMVSDLEHGSARRDLHAHQRTSRLLDQQSGSRGIHLQGAHRLAARAQPRDLLGSQAPMQQALSGRLLQRLGPLDGLVASLSRAQPRDIRHGGPVLLLRGYDLGAVDLEQEVALGDPLPDGIDEGSLDPA